MAWTKDMAKNQTEAFMFKELSDQEEKEFREWARSNPKEKPNSLYHPVVNDELKKNQSLSDET